MTSAAPAPCLLSANEAAAYLRVSPRTFRRHVQGALREAGLEVRICSLRRYRKEDLDRGRQLFRRAIYLEAAEAIPAGGVSGESSGYIYFIEAVGAGRIKIGWTGGNPDRRLRQLKTGCPFALRLVGSRPGTHKDERALHQSLSAFRIGRSEWFLVTPEVLAESVRP